MIDKLFIIKIFYSDIRPFRATCSRLFPSPVLVAFRFSVTLRHLGSKLQDVLRIDKVQKSTSPLSCKYGPADRGPVGLDLSVYF